MSKRARSDSMSLTGGTRDVNPQLFKSQNLNIVNTVAPSSAQTAAAAQTFPLPIGSFQQTSNGRATVMEILRGSMDGFFTHVISTTGNTIFRIRRGLYTGVVSQANASNVLDQAMGHPQVLAWDEKFYSLNRNQVFSENDVHGVIFDFTDGAGHGLLVGASQMSFCVDVFVDNLATVTAGMGSSNFNATMLYRFKDVPLSEYIGIQQSQQVNG